MTQTLLAKPASPGMTQPQPLLAFHGISKTYGRRGILAGLDLTVPIGDFMVVYGPPAAGKSVLLRILMGLEQPDDGQVHLRGSDVTNVPAADRNIGPVVVQATSKADNLDLTPAFCSVEAIPASLGGDHPTEGAFGLG